MSVAATIANELQTADFLADVPVFAGWADADRAEAPYLVIDVTDGAAEEPAIELVSSVEFWIWHPSAPDARRLSWRLRRWLTGRVMAFDPEGDTAYTRLFFESATTGYDGALYYMQTTWDARSLLRSW